MHFADELPIVGRVLHDAVGVHEIERRVGKRQRFAVGDLEPSREPLMDQMLASQRHRALGDVHSDDPGAPPRESDDFHAGAATQIEHVAAAPCVEVDQAQEVVQLLEMIGVQIDEEAGSARRVLADIEIMDMRVPIGAHGRVRVGHGRTIMWHAP